MAQESSKLVYTSHELAQIEARRQTAIAIDTINTAITLVNNVLGINPLQHNLGDLHCKANNKIYPQTSSLKLETQTLNEEKFGVKSKEFLLEQANQYF
jgi:hypothetical protein